MEIYEPDMPPPSPLSNDQAREKEVINDIVPKLEAMSIHEDTTLDAAQYFNVSFSSRDESTDSEFDQSFASVFSHNLSVAQELLDAHEQGNADADAQVETEGELHVDTAFDDPDGSFSCTPRTPCSPSRIIKKMNSPLHADQVNFSSFGFTLFVALRRKRFFSGSGILTDIVAKYGVAGAPSSHHYEVVSWFTKDKKIFGGLVLSFAFEGCRMATNIKAMSGFKMSAHLHRKSWSPCANYDAEIVNEERILSADRDYTYLMMGQRSGVSIEAVFDLFLDEVRQLDAFTDVYQVKSQNCYTVARRICSRYLCSSEATVEAAVYGGKFVTYTTFLKRLLAMEREQGSPTSSSKSLSPTSTTGSKPRSPSHGHGGGYEKEKAKQISPKGVASPLPSPLLNESSNNHPKTFASDISCDSRFSSNSSATESCDDSTDHAVVLEAALNSHGIKSEIAVAVAVNEESQTA